MKALAIVNQEIQEVLIDTGAAIPITISVTVSPAEYGEVTKTVNVLGMLPSKTVMPILIPNLDFDQDDLADYQIGAVANTDTIQLYISRGGPIVGTFAVAYIVL